MSEIKHELYTFEDKTNDEVLLMNGFQHINQLIPYINKLQQENNRQQNNWNELKECVIDLFNRSQDTTYLDILEKMQELENKQCHTTLE